MSSDRRTESEAGRKRSLPALKVGLAVALITSVLAAGSVFADQPITSDPPGATMIAWPGSAANQATYWETYFANLGFDYECTKVSEAGAFTTNVEYAAIVVKGGQYNFIWRPAPADTYTTNPGVSHWFYCTGETVEDRVIDPKGSIIGPCADPAYAGVFDNRLSTVAIKFRFRWYTLSGLHTTVKIVPPNAIYRTWEHWSKPNTYVSVWYQDPDTAQWKFLANKLTVRGNYPACQYKHGLEYAS
jgi:hypothetical protein